MLSLGFAALLPGFSFISAVVSNDSLAAATGAAFLLIGLVSMRQGISLWVSIAMGLVLGLGILTKRSLLAMLPLIPIIYLFAPARNWLARLAGVGLVLSTTLAVGIWPFLYNVATYGDPLATAATLEAKEAIASPLADLPGFWLQPFYVIGLFNSLWGVFGLRNVELPGSVYLFYYVLCLVAIVGLLRSYIVGVGQINGLATREPRAVLVLLGALVFVYAGVAYQNTHFWAIQGRLLLPGFAALSLLLGRGLSQLSRQILPAGPVRAACVAILLGVMALLNIYALVRHILFVYYS